MITRRLTAVLATVVICPALAVATLAPALADTPPGAVDLSFGSCGVRELASLYPGEASHLTDVFYGVAVQPDGRIVLSTTRSITRLLPGGLVDHGFGLHGVVQASVPDRPALSQRKVAIQPDGRILVSAAIGDDQPVLSRYLPDGRIDPSFGAGGHAMAVPGTSFVLQPDGRILSWRSPSIVRLTANGTLDPTFGSGGKVTLVEAIIFGIGLQPDGKLVVSAATGSVPEERRIVRLSAAGAPDPTFGTAGAVPTVLPAQIVVDSGGRIMWVTTHLDPRGWRLELQRLLPSGQPDPAIAPENNTDRLQGSAMAYGLSAIALQDDDRLVATITREGHHGLIRLELDGHLDRTYGVPAGSTANVGNRNASLPLLASTPDGDWLAAGRVSNGENRPVVVKFRGQADSGATAPTSATCTRSIQTSFQEARFGEVPLGLSSPPLTLVVRNSGTATVTISRLALLQTAHFVVRSDGCTGVSLAPGATCPVAVVMTPRSATGVWGTLLLWSDAGSGHQSVSLSGRGRGPLTTRTWGWNVTGQLGTGSTRPTELSNHLGLEFPGAVAFAAGYYHSLGLRPDGTVWAWGWNGFGQLGNGSAIDRSSPTQVPGLTGVVSITAGAFHSLAVTSDGSVWAWGLNHVGQLGDGTTIDRARPVRVGVAPVSSVSGGGFHTLAVASDGVVWSWGWNAFGQLGDGTTTSRPVPKPLPDLGVTRSVSAGGFHNLALMEDDSVRSWGLNHVGQLGDGTTVDRHQPVTPPLPKGSHQIVFVAAGAFHSVAAGHGPGAFAWGWNAFGQLGDGTTSDRWSPVPLDVGGIYFHIRGLTAGGTHSLLVGDDGTAWGWGWNGFNQVTGATIDLHVPNVIGSGFATLSAGWFHSLGG